MLESINSSNNCYKHVIILQYIDVNYNDPLGELPERPKTAIRLKQQDDNDFHDAELGDDLLPE